MQHLNAGDRHDLLRGPTRGKQALPVADSMHSHLGMQVRFQRLLASLVFCQFAGCIVVQQGKSGGDRKSKRRP